MKVQNARQQQVFGPIVVETGIQQLQLQQVMHLFAQVQQDKQPSSSVSSPKKDLQISRL